MVVACTSLTDSDSQLHSTQLPTQLHSLVPTNRAYNQLSPIEVVPIEVQTCCFQFFFVNCFDSFNWSLFKLTELPQVIILIGLGENPSLLQGSHASALTEITVLILINVVALIWCQQHLGRCVSQLLLLSFLLLLGPGRPRMDHRVVTSPGFVNVSRIAWRFGRSAQMGIFLDAIASPSTYPSDLPQAKVSRNRRKRF